MVCNRNRTKSCPCFGRSNDRLIACECYASLYVNQAFIKVYVFPTKSQHFSSSHTCVGKQSNQTGILRLQKVNLLHHIHKFSRWQCLPYILSGRQYQSGTGSRVFLHMPVFDCRNKHFMKQNLHLPDGRPRKVHMEIEELLNCIRRYLIEGQFLKKRIDVLFHHIFVSTECSGFMLWNFI